MTGFTSYAWATGTDIALVSLTSVEDDLLPYTGRRYAPPFAAALNLYPQRRIALDGTEIGDGLVTLEWQWAGLPRIAFEYIYDTYITPGGVTAMTIYTRGANAVDFARYNANLTDPVPGDAYEIVPGGVLDLTLTFTNVRTAS